MQLTVRSLLFFAAILLASIAAQASPSGEITDADMPEIKALITEKLPQAFADAMRTTAPFEAILTDDVALDWPNKSTRGKRAFIETIISSFKEDARLFEIATENFKFLRDQCGINDESLQPAGFTKPIDAKYLPGEAFAVNRFLIIAKFKHSWMRGKDSPYWYVDRFVVKREKGKIKIAEYEFTANLHDIPAKPTLITQCP